MTREEIKTEFNYERVIEIINRLRELGIPDKTIDSLRFWAANKKYEVDHAKQRRDKGSN